MAAVPLVTAGKLNNADIDAKADRHSARAGVAINAGQPIRLDKTTGTWVLALATTQANGDDWFIAHKSVAAGEFLTGLRGCLVNGFDLDDLDYNDPVYLSDTPGTVDDTAGTVSIVLGYVRNADAQPRGTAPDKVLWLRHA